jgi:hypothetical protein
MAEKRKPRAKVAKAIDLLERQACQCLTDRAGKVVKVQCLRCELLDLLDPGRAR